MVDVAILTFPRNHLLKSPIFQESLLCSGGQIDLSTNDHHYYFNAFITFWGQADCYNGKTFPINMSIKNFSYNILAVLPTLSFFKEKGYKS